MYNVFGRTLKKNGVNGRDHWGSHHATVMMGKNIKAGVVGGLEPKNNDYYATTIDSKTGAAAGTSPSPRPCRPWARPWARRSGCSRRSMDRYIAGGKVVQGALL
jgi:hypothetical protein